MARHQRCRNLKANGDHYNERPTRHDDMITKRARIRYFRRYGHLLCRGVECP